MIAFFWGPHLQEGVVTLDVFLALVMIAVLYEDDLCFELS